MPITIVITELEKPSPIRYDLYHVYTAEDVHQVEVTFEDGTTRTEWEYTQTEYTKDEYLTMLTEQAQERDIVIDDLLIAMLEA